MRGIAPKRSRGGVAKSNTPRGNKRSNTNGASDWISRSRDGGAAGGSGFGSRGGDDAPLCPGHNEECVLRTTRKEVRRRFDQGFLSTRDALKRKIFKIPY